MGYLYTVAAPLLYTLQCGDGESNGGGCASSKQTVQRLLAGGPCCCCCCWPLVFDRYDLPTSLKEATRERRQGGKPATAYHVEDNTPIGKVSAKQFLSSTTTKDEQTVYLAKKALHHFDGKPKIFIVTSRQNVFSNCMDVHHLHSSQEEADTRIILHSLDAAQRRATELYIQSPDTDVFVLTIRCYHQLCRDTYFITGVGNKKLSCLFWS